VGGWWFPHPTRRSSGLRQGAGFAIRRLLIAAALVATATAFAHLGLPSPFLLAAFAVGIAYALLFRPPLSVFPPAAAAAQGVIGVTAGSYLDR
jgi:uncharacterized membrane protein AbrB (regulator of aidB expression)